MNTAQIKQQLHDYIDNAEEKELRAIYTLLEDNNHHNLSREQMAELDKR
jgi:hypothetical protein